MPENNRLARQFGEDYMLITDSVEVAQIATDCGVYSEFIPNLTAAFVKVGDGEYLDVWFTESGRYYENTADYHSLEYFAMPCECSDPGCPCGGHCQNNAIRPLYRVDMADETGTAFCGRCAHDAFECGLFTDEKPGDEEPEDDETETA